MIRNTKGIMMSIRLIGARVGDGEREHLDVKATCPRGKPYDERGGQSWGRGAGTPRQEGHTLRCKGMGRWDEILPT
jgi:hypothetical protein